MLPSEEVAASVLLGIGDLCGRSNGGDDAQGAQTRASTNQAGANTDSPKDTKENTMKKDEVKKYIEQMVKDPGEHDVLCGRGGGTNNHAGNVKFRMMVNGANKLRYLAASKAEKPKVAADVVRLWRSLDPPGRFLARKDSSRKGPGSVKAEGNVWYDVGDKRAREKASQCLRERTPDVIPFVREIQRQQDILIGQGLCDVVERHISSGGAEPRDTSLPNNGRASQSPPLQPIAPAPQVSSSLVQQQPPAAAVMPAYQVPSYPPSVPPNIHSAALQNNAITVAALLRAQAGLPNFDLIRLAALQQQEQQALNPFAALQQQQQQIPAAENPLVDVATANANANLLLYAIAATRQQNARNAMAEELAQRESLHAAAQGAAASLALAHDSRPPSEDSGPVKKRRKKS